MDISMMIKGADALRERLSDREGDQIVEILEEHDQKYILVHPSAIFPFQVLLHYSLVDGKPRVEITSDDGGPRTADGVPNLRIDIHDATVWEDEERWVHLPSFDADPDDVEYDVRYTRPDRTRLARMWRMCVDPDAAAPRTRLILAYAEPNGTLHALNVVGFGSKFGGWNENQEFVENVRTEQVVAAMLESIEQ